MFARYPPISSPQNPKVKLARQLQEKKYRQLEGCFVVDYARDLARALQVGYSVRYVLRCDTLLTPEAREMLNGLEAQQYAVTADVLAKASYRQNPSGVVAVLAQKPLPKLADFTPSKPLLAIIGVEKPGNIGALMRTADASGFEAVLLVDCEIDLYNPNIIRASTGACFLNNTFALSSAQAYDFFTQHDYRTIAAHLNGTRSLYDMSFTDKTAILLGAEDSGLPPFWTQQSAHLVKIPMHGVLSDSLNVSVSGAIFMYEVLRQRLHSPA